jgi:hypothetical protein
MDELFLVVLVATTSAGAYLLGSRRLGFSPSLVRGLGKTLETVGVAVVFFGVNVLVAVVVVLGLRAIGVFASLYLATDTTLVGMSVLQAAVLQFWRYSKTTSDPR